MKKFVCVLLASFLLVSAVGVPAFATVVDGMSTDYIQNTTNAYDLQAYGIRTFSSFKADVAPVPDGTISTGEYPGLSNHAVAGDGLWFTNSTGKQDYSANSTRIDGFDNTVIDTYLAFDDTYAYVAEKVTTEKNISASAVAYVRYGLNQSELLPEAYSRLENSYTYTNGSTITVKSVAGDRYFRKLDDLTSTKKNIGTYTDPNGVKWDKTTYQSGENAAVSKQSDDGLYTFVFEYRIPLAEIAFTAFEDYNEASTAALVAAERFYGSYQFSLKINDKPTYVSTAVPGQAKITSYSGDESISQSTWGNAVKEFFVNANGGSVDQDYIPSPVYHFSDPATASVPASSGFRPGVSSYGFNVDGVPTVFRMVNSAGQYKTGDYNKYYTFSLVPAGNFEPYEEGMEPMKNDTRVVPVQFRLRSGYSTKLTGGFADFTKGTFDASKLPSGLYTLVVTFSLQKFDGDKWVDTGVTRNFARNITIAGSTRAATASSQTGDSTLLIVSAALLVSAAALCGAVLVARKRRIASV